jgi:prephenate dehydrogenase
MAIDRRVTFNLQPSRPSTVCIIGLGLMGGSLALALRQAHWAERLIGVDRDAALLAAAAGAIDTGTTDLAAGVAAADVVLLATPVRTILRLLPEVGRHAQPGALIMDLGSTKQQICRLMVGLPAGLEPVGGHPMCGKEVAGFAAAEATLFQGRPFVLCPVSRTAPAALELARSLALAAGARPMVLDPAVHDRAVGAISHLPYMLAVTLMSVVNPGRTPAAWSLAAGGFRDTSRVAGSDVDMMLDILLTNRNAVLERLDAFTVPLVELRAELDRTDESALRERLAAARANRIRLRF